MQTTAQATIHIGDRTITAPAGDVISALFGKPGNGAEALITRHPSPITEKIGAELDGGIYAGLTLHEGLPARLILLPGEIEDTPWDAARAWAEKQGGVLPSRIDQLVLLQNLKSQFKPECYWSGEQHADDSAYAWGQYFYDGNQYCWRKDNEVRARVVRRFPI